MRHPSLFSVLVGSSEPSKIEPANFTLKPSTPTCAFIEKGHIMEYIEVGPERKRIVSLFFGPQEFAVRCHLQYGVLETLDKGVVNPFTHGQIMHMLRKFPDSHVYYQEMRKRYQQKVADRINSLTSMTGEQRFAHLMQQQPWVFELADLPDIASYLALPIDVVNTLLSKQPPKKVKK